VSLLPFVTLAQAPYIALVCLLVAVPLVLPFAAAWSRRPGQSLWGWDARLGVRRARVDAYHPRAYWWEAVLMSQRLVSCWHHSTLSVVMA
jgi:hypothetical protein